MKRFLFYSSILLLNISFFSNCSSSYKDKVQNDSIAKAQIEYARIDSLKRDSIERRNLVSPYLAFNELHGDVKQCVYNDELIYTYDREGRWTNEPQWEESDKQLCPERTQHPKILRNTNGYITRIYWECEADYEYEDISWSEGKVKTRFNHNYYYNEDDFLIRREDEEEYDAIVSASYCNYEIDDLGNWITRDIVEKIYDTYQNSVRYELIAEKRDITYYNSNGGNHFLITNSPEQNEALNRYKEWQITQKEELKKGPDWINGTWVYKGYYNTRLGRVFVNVAIDIDRDNQRLVEVEGHEIVNQGRYEVYNGAIHINDTYFELDEDNQKIEYGEGLYLQKK